MTDRLPESKTSCALYEVAYPRMDDNDLEELAKVQRKKSQVDPTVKLDSHNSDTSRLKVRFHEKTAPLVRQRRGSFRVCDRCAKSRRRCIQNQQHLDVPPPNSLRFPLLRTTSSAHSRLSDELSYELGSGAVTALRAFGIVMSHYPARVGISKALDAAIESIIAANRGRLLRRFTNDDVRKYAASITSVREAVEKEPDMDCTLLAVVLLVCAEICMRQVFEPLLSAPRRLQSTLMFHLEGITSLLLHRLRYSKPSDMVRATFYSFYHGFDKSCMLGIPSPFDHPDWVGLMPLESESRLPSIQLLRKHSKQIWSQAPRLVSYVRTLRTSSPVTNRRVAEMASRLAADLYLLDTSQGETDVLHNVKITQTVRSPDAAIIPWSIEFNDYDEFEAIIELWTGRLLLLNLCRAMCAIPDLELVASAEEILVEQERRIKNIMMSWQYIYLLQTETHTSLPVSPFPSVLWSALVGRTGEFCGQPVTTIKRLVLLRLDEFTGVRHTKGDDPLDDRELASTASMLAGGPLNG